MPDYFIKERLSIKSVAKRMQHQPVKSNKQYSGKIVALLKFMHRFLSFIHQQRTYHVQFILHKHATT